MRFQAKAWWPSSSSTAESGFALQALAHERGDVLADRQAGSEARGLDARGVDHARVARVAGDEEVRERDVRRMKLGPDPGAAKSEVSEVELGQQPPRGFQ